MSTRANIIVKDKQDSLWFYRHSDGYPDGTMPTLEKFLEWVKSGKIRDNVGQASGWLILIGAKEYNKKYDTEKHKEIEIPAEKLLEPDEENGASGWKCGAYEPTTGQHGDIQFLYTVDLDKKEITVKEVKNSNRGYHMQRTEPAPFKGNNLLHMACIEKSPEQLRSLAKTLKKQKWFLYAQRIEFVALDKESGTVYY